MIAILIALRAESLFSLFNYLPKWQSVFSSLFGRLHLASRSVISSL